MHNHQFVSTAVAVVFAIFVGYIGGATVERFTAGGPESRDRAVAPVLVGPAPETTQPDVADSATPAATVAEEATPTGSAPPDTGSGVVPPEQPTAAASLEPVARTENPTSGVVAWVEQFSNAHESGDVEQLLATLHPSVPEAYGVGVCEEYVQVTLGSIRNMEVVSVSQDGGYQLPAPGGAISYPDAIAVNAQWTISASGETVALEFHLVPTADGLAWLSTCGEKPPSET